MTPFRAGIRLLVLVAVAFPSAASAQVVYPPAPEKYDAHFRYRIRADRDERIRQFREMEKHLKAIGFVATPRDDADLEIFDPTAERMSGTIPSANAKKLLDDSRIHTAVLVPAGTALDDGKKPLQVRIALPTGLAAKEQHDLHEQLSRHLGLLGFREGIAYDHRAYSLLRGTIPTENLLTLLKDVRTQPTGWFVPLVPKDLLPLPLRAVLPVRVVEVLPDLPVTAEPAPPVGITPASPKLTADARAVVEDPMSVGKPIRVDVILHEEPLAGWRDPRDRLRLSTAGVTVEGKIGPVVTVRVANTPDVNKLAALEMVRSIRLPRAGTDTARSHANATGSPAEWLANSKVADLHKLGYRGEGVRVVILSSGFPGLAEAHKAKALPANVKFIDLTAELSPDLQPSPVDPNQTEGGTAAAIAAHVAAPAAQLILVRIDPTAYHELLTVAQAVAGDSSYSEALIARSTELTLRTDQIVSRRASVTERYRKALSDLRDDPKVVQERKDASAEFDTLIADERVLKGIVERFAALKASLDDLRGAAVVMSTLVWDTGFPQDGINELGRLLDDKYTPKPVSSSLRAAKLPGTPIWVQPASPSVGQVWAGPFLDSDANGVMEFPAKSGTNRVWTPELNFLAFTTPGGKTTTTLPAGIKLRLTVQWREPHDPDGFLPREPVFPLTLRLLRQIDPEGKTVASDEFAEIGRSTDAPVRLLKTFGSGAYEQILEATLPVAGVYAFQVEGRPAFESVLTDQRQRAEVHPRVVVEPANTATAAKGRPMLATFRTNAAGVGLPGDSPGAVTIGIRGADGQPTGTLTGAGPSVQLRTKPDLLTAGSIAVNGHGGTGVGVAAGYAAGVAASLKSAGVRASGLVTPIGLEVGGALVIPEGWLSTLTPR